MPGITVEASAGFFNSGTDVAASDGSFEISLNMFNEVTVSATDPETGRTDEYVIPYNVDTTFTGIVKDALSGNPLSGVVVKINSSGQFDTTESDGVFEIIDPATGDQLIEIDATEAIPDNGLNKKYSRLNIEINIGTKQRNVLQRAIYVAPILIDDAQSVGESGGIVTSPHAQGAELDIPADAIDLPSSEDNIEISMVEIQKDRTSVSTPEYAEPDTVIALEPSGLKFLKYVKLTLPNVNEFPEGMELVILSKNSEKGIWEVDGIAEVTQCGNYIETKDGMGISHFSEVYAAPVAPEIRKYGAQDRPGADTFNGAMSTEINLPSYKSYGKDIAPGLIYRSSWSNPSILVSNMFKIPNKKVFTQSQDISDRGFYVEVVDTAVDRIVPEYIDIKFYAPGIESEKVRVTGIPHESIISYSFDLEDFNSGAYLYKSSYEIYLKHMILKTRTIKGFRFTSRLPAIINEEIKKSWVMKQLFPSELTGFFYVQNKINSSAGRGWKIAGVQRIENPDSSRILIEEADGNISSYVIDNTIETLYNGDTVAVNAASFNWPVVSFTDDQTIYSVDLRDSSPVAVSSGSIQLYSGIVRHDIKCKYRTKSFTLTRSPSELMMLPDGSYIGTNNRGGSVFQYSGGSFSELIASEMGTISGDICTSGEEGVASCGSFSSWKSGSGSICRSPGWFASTYPMEGLFADGDLSTASVNKPMGITAGPGNGKIVIADTGNNRVRLIDLNANTITTIAGNGQNCDNFDGNLATDACLYHPRGVVYDADGNLYISTENGYIRKVDINGRISTFAGKNGTDVEIPPDLETAEEMVFKSPYGMVIDEENSFLYVADTGNNRIVRINFNTMVAETVAGRTNCSPGNDIGDNGPAINACLESPQFVGLDDSNNLLIADKGNNRIRRVIFETAHEGILVYSPVSEDNSKLTRKSDGSFEREYRNGIISRFDSEGRQIEMIDRVGRSVSFEYNAEGLLESQTDMAGSSIIYEYIDGKLSKIKDPANRETLFTYAGDFLTGVSFPDGSSKSFSYENGLMKVETDQRGYSNIYEYNDWNRITRITRADGSEVLINDSGSATVGNNYTGGDTGELKSFGTEEGSVYDGIIDAKGIETVFAKDNNGYVTTIIDGENRKTNIERNDRGLPTKIIRPDLSEVTFTYDEDTMVNGFPVYDLKSKYDTATGASTFWEYDIFGNLLSQEDAGGGIISNVYLENGLLFSTTNSLNKTTTYDYFPLGLLKSKINPEGQKVSYEYDMYGNIQFIYDPANLVTEFIRDAAGNAIDVINAKNQISHYEFDAFNRIILAKTHKGEGTWYKYLPTGELEEIKDPRGNITSFYYNEFGKVIKKVDPLGLETNLFYDAAGNVVEEIDPNGNQKFFEYNNINQLTKKIIPDNIYQIFYDIRGNVSEIKNNNSQIILTYEHYDSGDLVSSARSRGLGNYSDVPDVTLNYSYDSSGNRTLLTSPFGNFSYSYDIGNRLTNIMNHRGESFSLGYNKADRLTSITGPAFTTLFSFDSGNFLTSIVHSSSPQVDISYERDDIGNRTLMRTPAGDYAYSYDLNNQLIGASSPEAAFPYDSEGFSYDNIGNRTSDQQGNFYYDTTKRLLEEDYKNLYEYDNNGNLIKKIEKPTASGNFTNYFYNSENQLTGIEIYESENLVKELSFAYDALGRRMVKKFDDHVTQSKSYKKRYLYDGSEILAEYNGDNDLLAAYTHSGLRTDDALSVYITDDGRDAGMAPSEDSCFFIKDGQGTITDITNSSGAIIQHNVYSAFGKRLKITDTAGNEITEVVIVPFSYTGREIERESEGLYYYRARYYDANIGRFLQVDPQPGKIFKPATVFNRYMYVGNNPMNFVDPEGLFFGGVIDTFKEIGEGLYHGTGLSILGDVLYGTGKIIISKEGMEFTVTAAIIITSIYYSPAIGISAFFGAAYSQSREGRSRLDFDFLYDYTINYITGYAVNYVSTLAFGPSVLSPEARIALSFPTNVLVYEGFELYGGKVKFLKDLSLLLKRMSESDILPQTQY